MKTLKSAKIEEKQPIYKVETVGKHTVIVSKNADVTLAYEVTLPEILTLSMEDYNAVHSAFTKALRGMPNYTVFHKQDWYLDDKYHPDFSKDMSLLTRSFERNFNERPFLHHKCYIYLTKTSSDRTRHSGLFNMLTKRHIVPKDMMDAKTISTFLEKCEQFEQILLDCPHIKAMRPLSADDICGYRDEKGKEHYGLLEKYLTLSYDGLCLQDFDFSEGLKIGNKQCSMYTIAHPDDLPPIVGTETKYEALSTDATRYSLGFATSIGLNLSCSHIVNQYIFIDDHAKRMKELEGKKANLRSLAKYSRENEVNMHRHDEYIQEATADQRLSIRAHYNVLVMSESKDGLAELRKQTSSAIAMMECRPREATIDIATLYWSGIPGNAGDFPSEETFVSFVEQAVCFLPLETNYKDSPSHLGIKLIDRTHGRPVHVDISDLPQKQGLINNLNKFIIGPSGSGKSFFTNHMVRQYHEQKSHIVLVDVGHSYKGLCDLVGGVYFTYDVKKPMSFNPFHLEGSFADIEPEKKESIKQLLTALWKREGEGISQAEYTTISDAITRYYTFLAENKGRVRACFDSFYEFFRDQFREILENDDHFKDRFFDVDNFLYILKAYYQGGEYDFLLNSKENLNLLHETFIVFELDNIKDHPILFPVVTLMIMETFISKMRKLPLSTRKQILIEEAWKAIAKEGTAEFIKYLFKTVRKFKGEAIVVTQEIDDIIGNAVIKDAIINNSDTKILLDQAKFMLKFDEIQKLLGLTDKQKAQVLSINKDIKKGRMYREVYIGQGPSSKVYAVEVSPEEYVVYSTNADDKQKFFDKRTKYGSIQTAIQEAGQEIREGVW